MAKMKEPRGKMPKEHWEKNYDELEVCDCRYAGEFTNGEELQRNADDLARYVRNNRMYN